MDSKARITGYAVSTLILVLIVWMAGLLIREAMHPARIIRVRFPEELGTLMVEDPVAQNGVPVGRVRAISLQDGMPVVEIELFRKDFIASDARFIDFNHSLMGARMVLLTTGHSTLPMDESRIQEGVFADGVAESLHRVEALLHLVAEVRAQMDKLFLDPTSPLSPENFRRLEENAQKLDQMAQKVDLLGKSLREGIEGMVQLEGSLQTGFHSVAPGMNKTADQTGTLVESALSAERSADAVLTSSENLLASVQDSGSTLHSLLYDPAAYEELKTSLSVLDNALQAYQNKGLSDVIRWQSLHFFHARTPPASPPQSP